MSTIGSRSTSSDNGDGWKELFDDWKWCGESLSNLGDEFDQMIIKLDSAHVDGEERQQQQTETDTSLLHASPSPTPVKQQQQRHSGGKKSPSLSHRMSSRWRAASSQVKRKFSVASITSTASSTNTPHSSPEIAAKSAKSPAAESKNSNNSNHREIDSCSVRISNGSGGGGGGVLRLFTNHPKRSKHCWDVERFPVPTLAFSSDEDVEVMRARHILTPPVRVDGQVVDKYQYLSLRTNGHILNNNNNSAHNNNKTNRSKLLNIIGALKRSGESTPTTAAANNNNNTRLQTLYNNTVLQRNNNNSNNSTTSPQQQPQQPQCVRRTRVRTSCATPPPSYHLIN